MYLVAEDALDLLWHSGRSSRDCDQEEMAEAEEGEVRTIGHQPQDTEGPPDGATMLQKQQREHDMQFSEHG